SHKAFGEALAILAGDGLLTLAFASAAESARDCRLGAADTAELIRVIAAGAGTSGMVGGQVADLGAEKWRGRLSRPRAARLLEYIHLHKTGALITASLEAGAILAGATAAQRRSLRGYARAIGLSFQVADDILDVVGDKRKLGKKGSDAANQKLTYVSLYGLERARAEAARLTRRAHAALKPFGRRAAVLHELAHYIVARDR
ncbi:MAG: polyprenyl synthetase family protein, partial [Elusimicrobia bacterium]|nr:polyprenyl synthetase family protein [Elusimicrobiota bacterium]